ncbi:MgtC/SapB family protein [Salinisphaera hydrothermalis]|uniref:Protein MgtC n=1 Tax=Salinisphaera hydrothermalis (strain C41B8) TaxID=1304275 RepID=A0A084II01_SALHC|nr:MgtC/SapB family protein [Salinisphaera hydrothermalis]KEZ76335.1 cation transporter MgtC/SapB [Salinisphaera hydrothermalis C41B8]
MSITHFLFPDPGGQGWLQIGELALAFVLSSLIGLEREFRMKSAGLRTHTLVGVGAALIVLVSKYGFGDVAGDAHVSFDPSRVAAQIVSGIGFIGGGLIFVRGDAVRGLTTAAVVWLTAAVGMACAAGLPVLAMLATAGHFIVAYVYTPFNRYVLTRHHVVNLTYRPREDVMHRVFRRCTEQKFMIEDMSMPDPVDRAETARATLHIAGRQPTEHLFVSLGEIEGVTSVRIEKEE